MLLPDDRLASRTRWGCCGSRLLHRLHSAVRSAGNNPLKARTAFSARPHWYSPKKLQPVLGAVAPLHAGLW